MEELIVPMGIKQNTLAVAIGIPPCGIYEIVHGKCQIIADTALRIGRYFGVTAQFWITPSTHYYLEVELDALGDSLDRTEPL